MSNITIPPAALEAGARALARYNCEQWDNDPDRWGTYFTDEARAAFIAMIEEWPMWTINTTNVPGGYLPALILPLTENPDAEA